MFQLEETTEITQLLVTGCLTEDSSRPGQVIVWGGGGGGEGAGNLQSTDLLCYPTSYPKRPMQPELIPVSVTLCYRNKNKLWLCGLLR